MNEISDLSGERASEKNKEHLSQKKGRQTLKALVCKAEAKESYNQAYQYPITPTYLTTLPWEFWAFERQFL